jgi:hypothetical protein
MADFSKIDVPEGSAYGNKRTGLTALQVELPSVSL